MGPDVAALVARVALQGLPTLSLDDEYPDALVADASMWASTVIMAWRELQ